MSLSVPQLQAIKTWVTANANSVYDNATLGLLNAAASPEYRVWKVSLGRHEITDEADVGTDGTTPTAFVWGGSTGGYINRSQGERDAWREMFNSTGSCKPSLANVRTAFTDIFSGAGAGAVANRAHLWARGHRNATVVEKLLAVQTVGGPSQTGDRGTRSNPDTTTFTGTLTIDELIQAESA